MFGNVAVRVSCFLDGKGLEEVMGGGVDDKDLGVDLPLFSWEDTESVVSIVVHSFSRLKTTLSSSDWGRSRSMFYEMSYWQFSPFPTPTPFSYSCFRSVVRAHALVYREPSLPRPPRPTWRGVSIIIQRGRLGRKLPSLLSPSLTLGQISPLYTVYGRSLWKKKFLSCLCYILGIKFIVLFT